MTCEELVALQLFIFQDLRGVGKIIIKYIFKRMVGRMKTSDILQTISKL